MNILKIILTTGLLTTIIAERVPMDDIIRRAGNRTFPSVFQTWGPLLDSTGTMDQWELVAQHDLIFNGPWFFKLQSNAAGGYPGMAVDFTPESIEEALQIRARLLELNPNLIIIGEVRYFDAQLDYLPADSPFWLRDDNGEILINHHVEGGYYFLDPHNAEFQTHVGNQCKALLETGVVDGCMMDWAKDDRADIFREVRRVIGDDAVLMGNVNSTVTKEITPLMNAVFMESSPSWINDFWNKTQNTVVYNHENLREPKMVCLELWPNKDLTASPLEQYNHMRAGTTLLLTHSNGCFMYYPDGDLWDHRHYLYPFWGAQLGKPAGERTELDGAWSRIFDNGTVVYNPEGNGAVTVTFEEEHMSQATGEWAKEFTVDGYDGGIFIKDASLVHAAPGREASAAWKMSGYAIEYSPFIRQIGISHRSSDKQNRFFNTRGQVIPCFLVDCQIPPAGD